MPKDQIGNLKAPGQFASVFYGAVVLLIGLEDISLAVKAEGLMEQPVAVFDIGFTGRIVWFVSGTGQPAAIFQGDGKAILGGLGGVDVEEGHLVVEDVPGGAVGYGRQVNPVANHAEELVLQGETADGGDGIGQAFVAVYGEIPFIAAFFHAGGNQANHPYDAQQVVRVLMGDEDMVDAV